MNQLILLLPLFINAFIDCLEAGDSSSIILRGSTATNGTHQAPQDSRWVLQGTTCKLFLQDIEYGPTDDQPNGYSEERWVCELAKKEIQKLEGLRFVEIVGADDMFSEATSGKSMLTVSTAIIDMADSTMSIPNDAIYELVHEKEDSKDEKKQRRNLMATTGTFKTLVVRVINSRGVGPDASATQLRSDVFEDAVSLRSQFIKCSRGQLQIQPFSGRTDTGRDISNGVVTVKVNYDGGDHGLFQSSAIKAATDQLGDLDDDKYDLIMFCFPPGTGEWLAYAFVNSKFSFYNNKWCQYVSAQMHEVGHNLGLSHSGERGEGLYNDKTGYMGFSYALDDQSMCFNPAKNFQLKWYSDQAKTVNPLIKKGAAVRTYKLNGVSDYLKDPEAFVVLRLEQTKGGSQKDYYIGFNRKDGMNKDTGEDENTVTIVRKENGGPDDYGQSMKEAALKIGFSYIIPKFNDERDVEIRYVAGGFQNKFAMIEIIDIERQAKQEVKANPIHCKSFTIEVQTDEYPDDNYWTVRESGGIGLAYARNVVYSEQNKFYKQEICLPYGLSYRFDFNDLFGDGICCSRGRGYYRVMEDRGQVMFSGSAKLKANTHYFSVGPDPNPLPETVVVVVKNPCRNKKGRFQWKREGKNHPSKRSTCNAVKKKGQCDAEDVNGKPMWQNCKKSCGECGSVIL
jgi:hypothetical protein